MENPLVGKKLKCEQPSKMRQRCGGLSVGIRLRAWPLSGLALRDAVEIPGDALRHALSPHGHRLRPTHAPVLLFILVGGCTTVQKPNGKICFPCKYQQTMASTMASLVVRNGFRPSLVPMPPSCFSFSRVDLVPKPDAGRRFLRAAVHVTRLVQHRSKINWTQSHGIRPPQSPIDTSRYKIRVVANSHL